MNPNTPKHTVRIWLEYPLYAAEVDGERVMSPAGYAFFYRRAEAERQVERHIALKDGPSAAAHDGRD